ncbi:CDP-glycerol glycerophosphotransferase family protein [Neobacillus sp. M.A.Huq-85]
MKFNVFLEAIYRLKNKRIKLIFNVDQNRINDINEFSFGIVALSEGSDFLLKTQTNIVDNGIEVIIPYKEISKVQNGCMLDLVIYTQNNNQYIKIINKLKKDFTVTISGEIFLISKSDHVVVNRKLLEEARIEATTIYSYKGKRFEISGRVYKGLNYNEINIKSFYLENNDTSEKILFEYFTTNSDRFNLVINLGNYSFYEGDWQLRCLVTLNNIEKVMDVTYFLDEPKVQGDYLEYNNSLYYFEISESKKAQIIIHIKKNKHKFILFDIKKVSLKGNLLLIQGFLPFCLVTSKEDKVTQIVLINRRTKEQISFPIEIDHKGEFLAKFYFDDTKNIIKEIGIWDVFVSLQISGITELVRIKMNLNEKNEEFKGFSKPIFNTKYGILKNIRSYITIDDNLAFQITDDIFTCDITKIELENGKTVVNGFIFNKNLNFTPQKIFLQNVNGDDQILSLFEFKKVNEIVYFTGVVDWRTLDIDVVQGNDYQFMISILIADKEYFFELVSNFDDIPNKSRIFIYPPLYVTNNDYPLHVRHYYGRRNNLLVTLGNSLKANCIGLTRKNKKLFIEISAEIEKVPIHSNDVELILKNVITEKEIKIFPEEISRNKTYLFKISENILGGSPLDSGNYEIFLSLYLNAQTVESRVRGHDSGLVDVNSTFKSKAIRVDEKLFFSLYFDRKSKNLNFEIRELRANEKIEEKIKFFLAKGLSKITKGFIKKPVWLIGENLGEIAQDNGFAFFKYCIENKKSERYYYVSKEDNKNGKNLIQYHENIVRYDSFKHYFLYWVCQYLIVSHGIRDVTPSIVHNKMNSNPKNMIYLQHGIIAMKKLKFNKDSYNGKIKKFVVSSVHEKEILIKKMNFKPKQIMVTGLARFDSLVDKSKEKTTKEILLIPTWREWIIDSETNFISSDFYLNCIDLLEDHYLHKLLEENNAILKFFPHIEIQKKYMHYFSSLNERIKIVNIGEQSVQDLIQESALLITDYSSVAFDFNYLKKPIIFYQFDIHEYLKRRGSYVDFTKDLIGDVAYAKEGLLKLITFYVHNDYKYKPIYQVKSKKYYSYRDRANSKRIYNEIKKLNNK